MPDQPSAAESQERLYSMFQPEELHPDLVPYVDEEVGEPGWPMLRHPLVFQVPYNPTLNRICNQQYAQKKAQVQSALAANALSQVLWLHERPYRPQALWDMANRRVDPGAFLRAYPSLVLDAWADAEFPWRQADLWRRILSPFVFHEDGPVPLGDERVPSHAVDSKTGLITVYRGHNGVGRFGFSYTLSMDVAKWFARRFSADGHGRVSVFTVPPARVVGFTTQRSESEVIALPECVDYVRTVRP